MPTNPGYHPDFSIIQYPKHVQAAIRKIASRLYVTRSFKPIKIGNSEYWAILVRPTDEFSVYINTDREVVVLFSNYETFEIRTLEAYEEFYELLESKRVDQSVRFLVSGDQKIEKIIKHYLDQHPEYPIIVPATLDQIIFDTGNALLDAVRRNYLLRDLFGYQNPLREETFFFGRQQVVNSVLDLAKSGQNSSLFGLRKSGKTSAIYAIQRKAKGLNCNVSVIDCQNPAVHARRYNELLGYVLGEVKRSIGPKAKVPVIEGSLAEISETFAQQMTSLLSQAKGTILLIFDEIENISPGTAASEHWRSGNDPIYFWQTLRSYLQSEAKGRLSVCIVGTSPQLLELAKINDVDNPVYLYAQKRFIPSLQFDETRDMVERLGYFMGLEFSPELIMSLQKEFGGHPFFTRQVCSKVHQLASTDRPIKVSEAALARAKTEFYGQLESYLKDIIGQLRKVYPDEFEILSAVTRGSNEEISEYGREAPDLIDHLIGYGLVERTGDDFDIRFDAIKNALLRIISSESPDDWLAEISKRRNALEVQIRVALYHWSRNLTALEWDGILEDCLTNTRYKSLPSHEPSVLFSSKVSPLYLTDLLMLVKDSRVLAYLESRRSLITGHMQTINKLRKDAHANAPSVEDMSQVRGAFDYLEGEFEAP